MIMKGARIVVTLASLLLAAGSALAQKVTNDWDKARDFSKYKTYAWVKGTPAKSQLNDERITRAIEAQLAAKGLQKVESGGNPELVVAYHAAVGEEAQFNTMNTGGWGYGAGWGYGYGGGGMSTTTVTKILTGQLVVDLGDVKDKKLIWRGTASDTLSSNPNPEKSEKKLNKAVEKLFKKYPPPVKK
jgi:Domain of unknown function (DUF4136)